MEALGKFGLDPVLFGAQVVNFLVIAFIIQRFLLRPLLSTLKERREKISRGLEDAEKARRALEDAAREKAKILENAYGESSRILENARDEAERLRAAALEQAGRDAEALIEDARALMKTERAEMEKAVQGLALALSGRILESVVASLFSEEEKARIVTRGLDQIQRLDRS